MRQIRRNVFETNSSSTHSIAICIKSEFDKWVNGELFYKYGYSSDTTPNGLITKEQAIEYIKSYKYYSGEFDDIEEMDDEDIYKIFREYSIYDYEHWGYDYEGDVNHYTTPNGEEIVAVCYYGFDG